MTEPAIELHGVGKRYVQYRDTPMLVTRALRFRSRTTRGQLWALRDIDVEVERGKCLGVIGRNGSGKSTMLRLLAGVTGPTQGTVDVRGRVAPLISVGVGFHNELTGRENVYVNGTILGMTRRQIDERFDEIVEFAELQSFIDTPVKFYSSGMLVRLGFSVAVSADPEILLVDEVLAVGDIAFQMRCLERMGKILESGATVLLVSHNLAAVRMLCPRTAVLHDGTMRFDGDTHEAIGLYHDLLGEDRELDDKPAAPGAMKVEQAAKFGSVEVRRGDGASSSHFEANDEVIVQAEVIFHKTVDEPVFGFAVSTEAGVNVYTDSTPWTGGRTFTAGTRTVFKARLQLALATGPYLLHVALRSLTDNAWLARPPEPLRIYVSGRTQVHGLADLNAILEVDGTESAESA